MKRMNKIYILLAVFVIICIAAFGVTKYEEKKELIKNSDEIILELDAETVTALSWEYASEKLAFHKDETWSYTEDEEFPVNEDKINELLDVFASFGVSFIIEEAEDYAQYGLDEPICTILLETEEKSYEIMLGDYSTMDSQRYVSIGDGNVYLVNEDPYDVFYVTLKDMIQHDEIPSMNAVSKIQFTGAENYTLFYQEDSTASVNSEDVYFTETDGETVPLDTTNVEDYIDTISYTGLTSYVTYNASEEELASYGLDNPELVIKIDYTYTDEETEEEKQDSFTLSISRDPKERKETADEETTDLEDAESETEDTVTAYARVGDSKAVYKLASDDYYSLMESSYDDLRHQEIFYADFAEVYQMEIALEGESYTITSETNATGDEEERTFYFNEEELDISDLRSAVRLLSADAFTDEEPAEKEEIEIVFYLENENYPEMRLELYRYNGEYCLAVVDGEPVAFVDRSYVVDLVESVNAIILN